LRFAVTIFPVGCVGVADGAMLLWVRRFGQECRGPSEEAYYLPQWHHVTNALFTQFTHFTLYSTALHSTSLHFTIRNQTREARLTTRKHQIRNTSRSQLTNTPNPLLHVMLAITSIQGISKFPPFLLSREYGLLTA
jgi:hypothetical protein